MVALYPANLGIDSKAMEDDGGVLGNLPRSRPGRRSEKRAGAKQGGAAGKPAGSAKRAAAGKPAATAKRAAAKPAASAERPAASAERAARSAERRDAPAARQTPGSEPRAARRAAAAREDRAAAGRDETAGRAGSDPVGDVIRTTTKVAGTGVRVAAGLAHEVLRRLPRP
jgi:hypothetical protein